MKWGRRLGLGLLASCVLASANYGCSREPEPGPDPAEIEAASRSFRRIDTENRFSSGPGTSTTGVIRSQKALDGFLETEHLAKYYSSENKAYYSAIRAETIDFPREALCLFCIMYGSASRESSLGPTTLSAKPGVSLKRHITFRLATKLPEGERHVAMIGIDCFPIIIDSSAVDTFSWEVDGVEVYTADLTKPSPALKEDSISHSRDVERVGRTTR